MKLSSHKHLHNHIIVINKSTYFMSIFDLAAFFFPTMLSSCVAYLAAFFFPTMLSSCVAFLPLPCPDHLLCTLLRVESSSFDVEELFSELNSIFTSNCLMPSVPLESFDSSTSSISDFILFEGILLHE